MPITYYLGGNKYIDDQLSEYIDHKLEEYIINPYDVSVDSSTDISDLSKLNKISRLIYDDEEKEQKQYIIEAAIHQLELQDDLLSSSKKLSNATHYLKMDSEQVDKNIEQAYDVSNSEVRQEILRINQEIKDKVSTVKRAEKAMAKLNEDPNLANFYSAQAYVEAVTYDDVKQTFQSDLNKNYRLITDELNKTKAKTEEEISEEIEAIKSREYTFDSGSSRYQQLSQPAYNAYTSFPNDKVVICVLERKIELYDNYQLTNQGIVASKSSNEPYPTKTKVEYDQENDLIKIAHLVFTYQPNNPDANISIDPNFYEILRGYNGQEVILIES